MRGGPAVHVTGRDRILKIEKRLFFESTYGVGIHIMHFGVPIICCINLIVNYASLSTGAVGYIYIYRVQLYAQVLRVGRK